MEREALAVATESLLQRQVAVIDAQREKIQRMGVAMHNMDYIIESSKVRQIKLNAAIFAIQAQSAFYAGRSYEVDRVKEENQALRVEIEELHKKMAQMTMIQETAHEEAELIPEDPVGDADENSLPEKDLPLKKLKKISEFYD